MSLDTDTLIKLIKRAAVEAVAARDPMALKIGKVVSVSPLEIALNQKITISASQLILTNAVRDHTVEMTVDHMTEDALSETNLIHDHDFSVSVEETTASGKTESACSVSLAHSHSYKGKKKFKLHLALKKGESVLMLRCDGGQKFIVLDRLEVQA